MAQFTVNPHRFDPYKNFKFRLKIDGRVIAGISKVSGLKRTTEVVTYREGSDPTAQRRIPGMTHYDPLVIERGVTHDTEFEQWANQVFDLGAGDGAQAALASFRKDVVLELTNEAGQVVLAYRILRCWPSEFVALPELDANGTAIAFQRLVLQNEGWERDASVPEPVEPKGGGKA